MPPAVDLRGLYLGRVGQLSAVRGWGWGAPLPTPGSDVHPTSCEVRSASESCRRMLVATSPIRLITPQPRVRPVRGSEPHVDDAQFGGCAFSAMPMTRAAQMTLPWPVVSFGPVNSSVQKWTDALA